ncbi:MAG: ABC transporter substrate-binding protein [bacterium]|nr:ABC transporter substrate-binding protein [bacterium]
MTACGGGSAPAASTATPGPTTINVGVLPIADVAPIYLGVQKGFFKQQNLNLKLQTMQGGAAVASSVLGGSLDFGFAAAVNLILAKDQGLPVKIVANGNNAEKAGPAPWSAIMVSADSPIKTVADLKGKTIAANALKGVNELGTDGIAEKANVDVKTLKITAVDFPDMPAALDQKRVDAVGAPEPFLSAIKAKGGRVVSPLFGGYIPDMTVGTWFTTDKEIAQKPDVVKAYTKAINQSLAYANAHPDEKRGAIATYTKIAPDALKTMALSPSDAKLNRTSIKQQEQFIKKLGWTKEDVDVNGLIWSGAP